MVDAARQMLDELMGRNRDKPPGSQPKRIHWDDPEFCQYYLVKFCPHQLFVNTRADLGACPKIHDDEAKRLYDEGKMGHRKRQYEDDFLRFCNNMINEVDRKIQKGRQRLLLMNKNETTPPVYVSKFQEQLNNLNARIKKLLTEAEEAGHRGDVDQAQGLTALCEQLKDEKELLLAQHDGQQQQQPESPVSSVGGDSNPGVIEKKPHWSLEFNGQTEKQMEVCEVCGAFLIVGDAQQRIEDHLTGKQHLGYSKVRKAIDEIYERRQKERDDEDRRREEERKTRENGRKGGDRERRSRENDKRNRGRDHDRRDRGRHRRERSSDKDRSERSSEKDRSERSSDKDRRERSSDKDRRERSSDKDRRERSSDKERRERSSDKERRERSSDKDRHRDKKERSSKSKKSRSRSRSHSRR